MMERVRAMMGMVGSYDGDDDADAGIDGENDDGYGDNDDDVRFLVDVNRIPSSTIHKSSLPAR